MKILIKLSFVLLVLGLGMTSCKDASKGAEAIENAANATANAAGNMAGDAANAAKNAAGAAAGAVNAATDAAKKLVASADKTYNVTKGSLQWTGTKKVGGQHMGAIQVSEGAIGVTGGKIVAGTATIDMKSITVSDIKDKKENASLVGHLSTGDFFEVEKFPTAIFNVTKIEGEGENSKISGDLTIKGITKPVTIPANVMMAGEKISIVSTPFNINRTEWGVNYSSGILGTAKDKIINDEIGLVLNLEAAAATKAASHNGHNH